MTSLTPPPGKSGGPDGGGAAAATLTLIPPAAAGKTDEERKNDLINEKLFKLTQKTSSGHGSRSSSKGVGAPSSPAKQLLQPGSSTGKGSEFHLTLKVCKIHCRCRAVDHENTKKIQTKKLLLICQTFAIICIVKTQWLFTSDNPGGIVGGGFSIEVHNY